MLVEAYAVPKSNPSSRITPVNNVMNLAPAAQADPSESESFNRGNFFLIILAFTIKNAISDLVYEHVTKIRLHVVMSTILCT